MVLLPINDKRGPPEGQKCWLPGDVVKVVAHGEERLIGLVFVVDEYSSMDFMDNHPRIKNPYPGPIGPLYTSFDPYQLVQASLLEILAIL